MQPCPVRRAYTGQRAGRAPPAGHRVPYRGEPARAGLAPVHNTAGAKSRYSANPLRITAYVVVLTRKHLLGPLTAAPIRPPLIAFHRFHRSADSPTRRSGKTSAIGHWGWLAPLRAHLTAPYKPPDDRKKQRLLISTSYRAVGSRPEHLRIVAVPSGSENLYILVAEDIPVQRGLRRLGRAGPCSRWRPKRSQRPGRPR